MYGETPPLGVVVMAPVLCPKQPTGVGAVVTASAAGCVKVEEAVAVQGAGFLNEGDLVKVVK